MALSYNGQNTPRQGGNEEVKDGRMFYTEQAEGRFNYIFPPGLWIPNHNSYFIFPGVPTRSLQFLVNFRAKCSRVDCLDLGNIDRKTRHTFISRIYIYIV